MMEIEVPRRAKATPSARNGISNQSKTRNQPGPDPDWAFLFDEDTESVEWRDLSEKKKKKSSKRIYLGIAATAIAASAMFYQLTSSSTLPMADELTSKEVKEMTSTIQQTLREKGPVAAIALAKGDSVFPSFVIGTNLPEGAVLQLSVEGISETLNGRFQFSTKSTATVHKGIVKFETIRQAGGLPLAKGEYIATVHYGEKVLADKVFFLGGPRDRAYEQSLKEYHTHLQAKSESELNELKQLVEIITRQVLDLNSHFQQYARTGGQRKNWLNFLKGWDVMQKQIAAPFAKWNHDSYVSELFYGEMYREMKAVLDRTDAIQGMQSRFLDLGFVDRGLADEIANEISALHGDLAGIQAKIQAAEALPMTSNGMPQRPDYTAAN